MFQLIDLELDAARGEMVDERSCGGVAPRLFDFSCGSRENAKPDGRTHADGNSLSSATRKVRVLPTLPSHPRMMTEERGVRTEEEDSGPFNQQSDDLLRRHLEHH